MTRSRFASIARYALFATLLLGASTIREAPSSVVDQAIIWLPTGVAMAGLFLLGLRAWWIVGLATLTQRFMSGYEWSVALPAVAGSSIEAMLGVLVLRRLGFDRAIARLRDVGALLVAAAVAPMGSILCSYLGRMFVWANPEMPFYSGWDGWWRMNALGVLTVVPTALLWLTIPRHEVTPRLLLGAALAIIGIPVVLGSAMVLVPGGTAGILWLNLVFGPLVLYAAVRFGMRGATLASTLAALVVAVLTIRGYGPFVEVAREQRHASIQLFEFMFVALPPAFGALIAERRAAQDRGVRSEELRRSIQSALPDITYQLRRDGTCLDIAIPPGVMSPAPREVLIGRSVFDLVPPDQARAFRATIERAFTEATPALLEYEIEVGGRRQVREGRCVANGTDEVLLVVRDITERKWAEGTMAFEARVLELVAAGEPPADVFEAIVRGIEALTPGGRCSIIVLDGRSMHVAMAPSLPDAFNAAVEGLEIGPMVGSCGAAASSGRVVVVREIDTDPLWAPYREIAIGNGLHACWSVPIRDSNGTVLGTFAVYYGVPREPDPRELQLAERAGALAGIVLEREQRSEALRRSEDLLASINRNVKEGIFRSSREGRALYANLALARMFGFETPEEVLGLSFPDAILDAERGVELARIAQAQGQWLNEEVECRRPDGSTFWGLLSGTAVRDASGEITHFDGAVADISARKELEMQFRQSQKMEAVGKLAGGVAHDFNNLLTVIFGYADAIRTDSEGQPHLRGHAEQVLDAAGRASRLTRQLLAYSRQQVMSPRVLELTSVVDQMSGMLRRLIGEDLRLVVEHRSGPCWVKVDPSQIEQVLLNLIVNARDASPSGTTLTIGTELADFDENRARAHGDMSAGPCVLLCVHDTGAGMTPEVRARAFDPFFTTKGPGEGTGLGLSTVYGIVKQSGGAVWIDSAPGEGTTVWIGLPRSSAPAGGAPEVAVAPAGPRDGTLLVVEDEVGVRDLVCLTLRREGFRVLEAGDGEQALEIAASWTGAIDLVVTDVVMPRMGGREMALKLARSRPGQRFLFISGYPDDARATQEVVGDSGAFLSKPFTPDQLIESVHALMRASGV